MPALCSFPECKQSYDVTGIGMEDLLFSCVCWRPDITSVDFASEIFDMSEHHVCWFPVMLVILPAPNWSDMGGNPGIYDDVFLTSVLGDWHTANHLESMPVVDFSADISQGVV